MNLKKGTSQPNIVQSEMSLSSIAFVLFIFSLLTAVASIPCVINITEENELEQFLCSNNNNPLEQDTRVVLSTSMTHYISSYVSLCVINTTYSLTLTTDSSSPAVIQCNQTSNLSHWPTTGFVFTNVHSLTIQRLNITGCGGFLKNSTIIDVINSTDSPVYFTQHQSVVLLFLHINTLMIEKVNITTYYGFALLAINPLNALIQKTSVTSAANGEVISAPAFNTSLGSGILLFFTDHIKTKTLISHNVSVKNCEIRGNVEYLSVVDCLSDLQYVSENHDKKLPVTNAAGLTILYAQNNFTPNVTISYTTLGGNIGSIAGAMLILLYKTHQGNTILNHTKFGDGNQIHNQKCKPYGASLALVLKNVPSDSQALIIDNSKFKDQKNPWEMNGNNAIFIGVFAPTPKARITVTVSNSNFTHNSISTTGACLYAKTYYSDEDQYKTLNITLKNIRAHNNGQTNVMSASARAGVFSVHNSVFEISGDSHFYNNYGSVFEVFATLIKLNGILKFSRNKAESGAAFNVHGNSHFYLSHDLSATFINNTALSKGGAIYAFNEDTDYCIFRTDLKTKVLMTFINNTASEAGSSIYGNNLFNCDMSGKTMKTHELESLYKSIFKFTSPSSLNHISAPTFEITYCPDVHLYLRQLTAGLLEYINPIYPGQRIMLPLYAKDTDRQHVIDYAMITVETRLYRQNSSRPVSWKISMNDYNQILMEGKNYTRVFVTLLKLDNLPNPTDATLRLSSHFSSFVLTIKLDKLSNCPIGFELNVTQRKCVCSKLLYNLGIADDDCQISPEANHSIPIIKRPTLTWLGLIKLPQNGTTVIGAAKTCYLYCKEKKGYTVFVVNSTNVTMANPSNPSNNVSLCHKNREGPLCSQCSAGYSVVFGSNECKQCSNWWLLTLIVYAVAGPLFIYILYALKLTLSTGTLNGIIFCAQMYQVATSSSSKYDYSASLIDGFFFYKFNHPCCFYNGMTEFGSSGIILLYPVYLLMILFGLILLSRYSVKLSNRISGSSIQVLVTIVHFSFSRLLTSILDVFTPISIYTNTSKALRVWFRDATLEYGSGHHLVLMIITLVIVGPILGVYMTVLLAGRPLMRINYRIREYLRPVYEAIHAPYKRNKEFFFVARLLIIIMLYFLYILFRGGDIYKGYAITSPILTTYTALEGLCRPFKKMSLNIFNFILLSLASITYGTGWYLLQTNKHEGIIIINVLLNSTMTISLIGVIILHILWVTGLLDKLKTLNWKRWPCQSQQNQEASSHVDLSGSFFEPYDRVREPLLSTSQSQYN